MRLSLITNICMLSPDQSVRFLRFDDNGTGKLESQQDDAGTVMQGRPVVKHKAAVTAAENVCDASPNQETGVQNARIGQASKLAEDFPGCGRSPDRGSFSQSGF